MNRNPTGIQRAPRLVPLALVAGLALGACSAGGGASASPSPSPTDAMMEASPSPSPTDAMMETSPSPSQTAATNAPVSMGTFHAVDGPASGTATLFHLANGSFEITFESFAIGSATGIHVALVPNKDVKADGDIDRTTLVDLGQLTGTAGMLDFKVPATADAMTFHTVLLWDTEMAHAIAAAPLQ